MFKSIIAVLGLLALPGLARAQDDGEVETPGLSSFSVLVGTSSAFDGNPATMRLSVRGEMAIEEGDVFGGYFLIPVTLSTRGEDEFGFSSRRLVLEVPASLRGRLFPDSMIRGYGDVGLGLALGTNQFEGWFDEEQNSAVAFMTRTAIGAEIGDPDQWSFVIEPASWSTYFAGKGMRATYGLMLGAHARL